MPRTKTIGSHAFDGTPNTPCRICALPASHAVHTVGEPAARVASTPPRSPAVGRPNALRDVLRMLEQALAYSGATDRERCEREELLRTAVATVRVLCSELDRLDTYAARVTAQTARIDAHLNKERRKQRKHKR